MPNFEDMPLEQLAQEAKRNEQNLEDARQERVFLGKQSGMHISVAELNRLDRDIERYQENLQRIQDVIAKNQESN